MDNPIASALFNSASVLIPRLAPAESTFWRAVAPRVQAHASEAKIAGFCGLIARSLTSPLLLSDVTGMWLPGLAALGLRAELEPLPPEPEEFIVLLRERLRHKMPVPLLAVEPVEPGPEPANPRVIEILAATEIGPAGAMVISTAAGDTLLTVSEFPGALTHLARLRRSDAPGRRAVNALAALLRLAASGIGDYHRRPVGAEDAVVRAIAAAFLAEMAGSGGTPYHVRLRRAANAYRSLDALQGVEAALEHLLEAICLQLRVPPSVRSALTAQRDLTRIEIQELIYLARAGTREMRAIAGARLALAPDSDARATIALLRQDSDALVRCSLIMRR